MRFAAPADVSEIFLSSGPVAVVDGFVEVPDDASQGDLGGLAVNGFVIAPEDPAPAQKRTAKAPADATAGAAASE